ncbi:hypothetical protein NM688_g7186 [Phlebia brevispora]|uniref:Uncharacterized protein n=1 Tax=Phlebia brevispora TaxID=194682 RepID=A0ACC1S8C3_9APHY|nr:hypothetical protein NM688_g7186 [Phlebia brevispora]
MPLSDLPQKHPKKKCKITQSDQLGDSTCAQITESAYPFLRACIACIHGFPPAELRTTFARDSFVDAFQDFVRLGYDLKGSSPSVGIHEVDLIEDRISQTQGDLRQTDPFDIMKPNTVYHHPMILYCVKEMWFSNENDLGVKLNKFFSEDGKLPLQCVVLVISAIRYGLDEWKMGVRTGSHHGIKYTDKDYASVYEAHLKALRSWQKYTSAPGHSDATAQWQKDLLDSARAHAGITIVVDEARQQTTELLTDTVWANNDG